MIFNVATHPEKIEADTFGHLTPEPGRKYSGYIVFAHTVYGDIVAIDAEFIDLPDSPWFFRDLNDFIALYPAQPGAIYRWEGTYKRFKNSNYSFVGKTRRR